MTSPQRYWDAVLPASMTSNNYLLTTDSTPSVLIHINSKDANQYIDPELTTGFSIVLDETIEAQDDEYMLLSLNSANIPYSWYSIDYKNKYLNITESQIDGSIPYNIQIVIPEANYNAYEFASTLQTLLNNATQHQIQYTITYDKKINKYNILIQKNNHKVVFNFSNSDSPYLQFGFNKQSYTAIHNTSLQSINSIQMFSVASLYIRTNLNNNNISTSTKGYNNILQKITIDSGPNSIINHIPINSHDNLIFFKSFSTLEIRLTDSENRLIDLQGLHWELSILCKFVKKVNYQQVDRTYQDIPIEIID